MSTPTLDEADRLFRQNVLVDSLQIMDVGQPVTVGATVTRALTPVGVPVPGLVQTTVLENAVESNVNTTYSIKVPRGTTLIPGQAVKVLSCRQEPGLVGEALLVDKVSLNGVAMIRKAVASSAEIVNQEGKEALNG